MNHVEFDQLVDRHLDGGLDLAAQERLEKILHEQPSLRRRFWDLANIHGHLAWVEQERHVDLPSQEAITTDRELRHSSTQIPVSTIAARRTSQKRQRKTITASFFWRTTAAIVIAASVAVVIGLTFVTWNTSPSLPVTNDTVIVDLADAHWHGAGGPVVGEAVGNRTLIIDSGLAQLRFASGATVILRGPTTFTPRSSRGGKLDHGQVVARVPESASGFTIESDVTRVVDLGTEFGFTTTAPAGQEIHVFNGLVQVFAAASSTNLPQALHRGEAVRINHLGAIAPTTFDEHNFIRAMPAELASPSLTLGLVAHWKLDETTGTIARDDSGHDHHGTLHGATFEEVTVRGKVDNALRFSGRSYIDVPDHPQFQLAEMTIHAWIKPEAPQHFDAQIISKASNYGLAIPRNQAMKFYFWDVDREVDWSFALNKWVNLCATFDGQTRRFYVDGVRIASITSPPAPVVLGKPLYIGALKYSNVVDSFFHGAIDDIRIYNRALSDNEVHLLFLSAAASPTLPH